MKFSEVTILQGVEFSIFPIDFEWALQQCSATALPVILVILLIFHLAPKYWPRSVTGRSLGQYTSIPRSTRPHSIVLSPGVDVLATASAFNPRPRSRPKVWPRDPAKARVLASRQRSEGRGRGLCRGQCRRPMLKFWPIGRCRGQNFGIEARLGQFLV